MEIQATIVYQKTWEAIHARNPDGSRRYRYILHKGSSRSSKTTSLIDCYDNYARANLNKRLTVWRDTKTDCKKTVLNDALKHLKKSGRYKYKQEFNKTESIFTYDTGSTFEIHGTDDDNTVHGLTQDAAWFNEPYKISKEVFDQVDQRTSDFIFIDLNPKMGHWSDDIAKDPRTIVIHSTFKHNPFCPDEQRIKILSYQPVKMCDIVESKALDEYQAKEYDLVENPLHFTDKQIKELSRCRENEHKKSASEFNWSVYGLGLKAERPNRILRFKEISYDEYLKINSTKIIGCDWGAVHPWGVLESKCYDNNLYLHELNYKSENEWRADMSDVELAQINTPDENGEKNGIVSWLFAKLGIGKDLLVICDNNRVSKILALRQAGWDYAVAALKPPGSVVDGIDLLNDITVYYTSGSMNLCYEQENYSRKVDNYGIVQEEPEDRDNHLIDPARYIAMHLQREGILKNG